VQRRHVVERPARHVEAAVARGLAAGIAGAAGQPRRRRRRGELGYFLAGARTDLDALGAELVEVLETRLAATQRVHGSLFHAAAGLSSEATKLGLVQWIVASNLTAVLGSPTCTCCYQTCSIATRSPELRARLCEVARTLDGEPS
jgi:hypothetical protein